MGGVISRQMTDNEIVTSLKEDFKLFLQALWDQLGLPSPTRAQYAIADYLQTVSYTHLTLPTKA